MTPLQVEIVCEAKKWIGVVEQPTGSNCGPEISQFNRYYFGEEQWSRWSEKERCQPYCVTFAYFVVDRAIRRLGGINLMPAAARKWQGDVVWGNAKRTVEAASYTKGLVVNVTPAVGAVFFRTSTQPGDGSSGHMGIVVGWDGARLSTVEGNQGTTHKVDAYVYALADLDRYGFRFIHVETTTVTATKPSAECAPQNVDVSKGSGTNQTTTRPTTGSPQQSGSQQGSPQQSGSQQGSPQQGGSQKSSQWGEVLKNAAAITNPGGQDQRTAQEICKDIQQMPCDDVAIIVNPVTSADAMTVISHPWIQDDILGGFRGDKYNSRRIRNGSALARLSQSDRQDDYSGWGMFRDGLGNVWYVMNEGHRAFHVMQDLNLFAPSAEGRPYIIPLIREFGDGWKERSAEILSGARDQNYRGFGQDNDTKQRFYDYPQPSNSGIVGELQDEARYMIKGRTITYRNFLDIFKAVNEIGRPLDAPIVVIIGGDAFGWKQAGKLTAQILDFVTTVAGPFAESLNMPWLTDGAKNILGTIRTTLHRLVFEEKGIGLSEITSLLTPLVKSVAPPEIRDLAMKGADAYQAIRGGNYMQAAQILGLNTGEIGNFAGMVEQKVNDIVNPFVAQSKEKFNEFRAIVQNVVNTRAIMNVGNGIASGQLLQDIITRGLVRDPDLAALLSSGASEVHLPLVPGISAVMQKGILRDEPFANGRFLHGKAGADDVSVLKAMTLTAMGVPPQPGSLDRLAYKAVFGMAQSVAERGSSDFVMPATVPDDKKECWAAKIRDCLQMRVMIQGSDPDGTIRLDTGATTGGSSMQVVREFDRPPVTQKPTQNVVDTIARQADVNVVERYTANPQTQTVVKELFPATSATSGSNRLQVSATNKQETTPYLPVDAGDTSTGRMYSTGLLQPGTVIQGSPVAVPGGSVTTVIPTHVVPTQDPAEIKRQKDLDEYFAAVARQEAEAKQREEQQRRMLLQQQAAEEERLLQLQRQAAEAERQRQLQLQQQAEAERQQQLRMQQQAEAERQRQLQLQQQAEAERQRQLQLQQQAEAERQQQLRMQQQQQPARPPQAYPATPQQHSIPGGPGYPIQMIQNCGCSPAGPCVEHDESCCWDGLSGLQHRQRQHWFSF